MIRYKLIPEKRWSDVNHKLQKLNTDIDSATEFVREIERGNLDASIGGNAIDSELKASLVNMRDQMKKYSLTEKQRNWVNEGLAKFVQILRSGNNDGRQTLSDNIIRNLVVYLKANQGALFALNDDDSRDPFLEMEACYAYDRKKFLEKRIALGEGLAGQVVLEKSTLYMTDVPKDFLKITSGLGEALPRNILVVPLKLDEKVYGVVEIASFEIFLPYQIDFVERLGESIASTIAAVKNAERTNTLLKETQLQAEQMKAQEEEVRQNLEELSATQEAMQRAMSELGTKEAYISQILNTSQDVIYTVDREFRMVTWNSAFAREAERVNIRIEKGINAFEWSPDQRRQLIPLYERAFQGETFELKWEGDFNGKTLHFLSVFAPIKSDSGEIIEAGIYARHITPMVEAQQESARHLKESQQQAEELKAQEEELRQNMEELSATQDAMQRAMTDLEGKEAYSSELLNATDDLIYTVDKDFKFITWNKAFGRAAKEMKVSLEKDMIAFGWLAHYRQALIPLWTRALKGETFQHQWESEREGGKDHYFSIYAPVRSKSGEILEVVVFAKNVGQLVEAQQESARLLGEAQQQAEELKAQEEELRQNMEELASTQEAMQRAMTDLEGKEAYASELLNATDDLIYTVDKDFRFITWNKAFGKAAKEMKVSLEKDMIAFGWLAHYRKALIPLWTRALKGETFQHQWESEREGGKDHYSSIYAPVRSKSGEILEVVVFAKNVGQLVEAQQESARLLKEAQQQTEELKAQEEELRQNMEELSATQETMERATREAEQREEYTSKLLNVSRAVVFTVDQDFKLVTWNQYFEKTLAGLGVRPEKGMLAFGWRPENERLHFVELFTRVFKGETFETRTESKFDGTVHHFHSTYAPIKNKNNEIVEAAVFAKDITGIVSAHKESIKHSEDTVNSVGRKRVKKKGVSKHRTTSIQSIAPASSHVSNGKNHHNGSSVEEV